MDLNEHDNENTEGQENVAEHDKTIMDGQANVVVSNQTSTELYENVHSTSVNITPNRPAIFSGDTVHNVASINGTEIDENSKVADDTIPEKELGVVKEVPISDVQSDTTCSDESEDGYDQCQENSFVFERNVTVKIRHNTETVDENVERTVAVDVDVTTEEITDSDRNDISTHNTHLKLVDYEVTSSDRSGEQNTSQPKVSATEPMNLSVKPDLNFEDIKESLVNSETIKQEPNEDYEEQTVTETRSDTVPDTDKASKILSMYKSARTEDTVDTLNDDRK